MTTSTRARTELRPMDADVTSSLARRFEQVPHARAFGCQLVVAEDVLSQVVAHVSNIEYVRWLDRAAELHSDACGYSRTALLEQEIMWFVARHEIDYLQECHAGDELVILTWARSFSRVKAWRDYCIVRPDDGAVVCCASTLWILVDLVSRRPRRIDAKMIAAFDPLHATAR